MTGNPRKLRESRFFNSEPRDWMTAEACACATEPPELFLSAPSKVKAKAICAACPVQEQCRQWAIDNGMIHGFWGGTTQAQRIRLIKVQ